MFGSCNACTLLTIRHYILSVIAILAVFNYACDADQRDSAPVGVQEKSSTYLNAVPGATYTGMQACRSCHENIYQSFIRTGMGKSFDLATQEKSSADFSHAHVYDQFSDLHYHAHWMGDSLFMTEFRLGKKDTLHSRTEQVNYIIGSGQHTNSHLHVVNGYLTQMPMTFYTQKKRWDLPPGFEGGFNTRFGRKIGLECMSCHNAFPEFVAGSENKFVSVPGGIDCERCHGPGSLHVEARRSSAAVDTSREIDYTIVNPAKLSLERQFDICQRCHLQGNMVLKEGKSFYDFKPSMVLSDYISVFMPRYKNDESFIMASHVERLKMSPCFIKSLEKADNRSLKPYRNALTCVTCHNPHVSVLETSSQTFNAKCLNCHSDGSLLDKAHENIRKWNDCVSCHMPKSGSSDIPHVTVHDHYIRKPVKREEKEAIKRFLGLYSINEKNPDARTRAKAYLDQYEKFKQDRQFLDSAEKWLKIAGRPEVHFELWIHYYFVRGMHQELDRYVKQRGGHDWLTKQLVKKSYDNGHAWTAYRAAESFQTLQQDSTALVYFELAVRLAPYNLDFRNKYATTLLAAGRINEAVTQLQFIMNENPEIVTAYSNLGYIHMLQGSWLEARRLLLLGKKLDPDNEALLLNLATCHLQLQEKEQAIEVLEHVVHKNPQHSKAVEALRRLR